VRELVDRARSTHPELPDVILRVQPDNARAIRAYRAAGFVDVPEKEQATWNEGQRHVYHWMVMPAAPQDA
jgi:RimJ/RimL family protein N-acetyltransferase